MCVHARAWPGALLRHLSWQIFPLVGGLFVLVAGAGKLGAVPRWPNRWLAAPRGALSEAGAAWLVGLAVQPGQ